MSITPKTIIAATLALCIAAATLVAAVGKAAESGTAEPADGAPVQFAESVGPAPTLYGAPAVVAHEMAASFPAVAAISTGATDRAAPETTPILRLAVNSFDGRDTVRPAWEAHVLVAALAERYAASGLPPIKGFEAFAVRPDGTSEPLPTGLGNVVRGQIFADVTPKMLADIKQSATDSGLTNTKVQTLHALQDAVVVSGGMEDPEATVSRLRQSGGLLANLLGRPPTTFEATFVEIHDTQGRLLYAEGTAARAGAAFAWADPKMAIEVGSRLK